MVETKDKNVSNKKIKETRFVIFIPLLITAICVWFDFLYTKDERDILDISKMVYTYFFPSIASTMITLIIQKAVYDEESCTIADNRVKLSSLLIIIYAVTYISCLYEWSILASIIFGFISAIYILLTWFFCLDKKITHNLADPAAEERAALRKYNKRI